MAGGPVTVTVHVDCNAACGAVDVLIDSVDLGSQTLDASGNLSISYSSFPASALTIATHNVVANYLGDSTHAVSSGTSSYTIVSPGDFVSLSMSNYAFTAGEDSIVTVHVACTPNCPSSGDDIYFTLDGVPSSYTFIVFADGNQYFHTYDWRLAGAWPNFNTPGNHSLAVHYFGNGTSPAADSSPVQFTMQAAGPQQVKPTLTMTKTAYTLAENSTLTIHHDCNTACGQAWVSIDDDLWMLLQFDSNGNAHAETWGWWNPDLTLGTHTLVAHYLGNATYAPMDSDPLQITIQAVGTQTLPITFSVTPQTLHSSDNLIASAHFGCGPNCGVPEVRIDGNPFLDFIWDGYIQPNGDFYGSLSAWGIQNVLTPGEHTLQMVFLGNAMYGESYSNTQTITYVP